MAVTTLASHVVEYLGCGQLELYTPFKSFETSLRMLAYGCSFYMVAHHGDCKIIGKDMKLDQFGD